MRYRWKILILLLAIALVPIMVVRTFSLRAFRQHGNELIAQSRENRVAGLQNQIQLLVNSYASVLEAKRKQIEGALLLQAREVERSLAKTVKRRAKVYFAEDFNAGVNLPADATPSPFHFRLRPGEATEMLKVSYAEQVFKLAPGAKQRSVEKDIARLATVTPTYKEISQRLQGLIFWQYTSLGNGLHSAYPGHNGIPLPLDSREEPWYQNAIQTKEPWSNPYIDPETRRVVIAAVMPVKRPDGEIAGVTALVVPVSSFLNHRLLSENIPRETEPFMVYLMNRSGADEIGARILASDEYINIKRRSWRARIGTEWLISSDAKQHQEMLQDLEAGVSKIRRMPFRDKDSLWVYGPVYSRSHLVLITPYEEILKPAEQARQYLEGHIDSIVMITRYSILVTVLLVIVLAFLFSRTVTKPIHALAEGAKQLSLGKFESQVDIRSRDEFGDMGKIFNSVGPRLKELYDMRQSLGLAMEVQQNLLPGQDPHVKGLDIAGKSIYCDETGGDYYDFLATGGQSKIGIVVGDVSDHGIPSALLMTTARAFLRQRAAWPGSIKDIVSDVNRLLTKDVETSGRFMSLFYAEIDSSEQFIRWVRAGHDPALFYDPATDTFGELAGKGLPLGTFEDTEYEEQKRAIAPGHIIVIGTDGIWETMNSQGIRFGKENLKKIIRTQAQSPAKQIVSAVIEATNKFREPLEQKDDVTIVIIKVMELGFLP